MSRSAHRFYKWLGFAFAVLVSGVGAILGWIEEVPHQHVIFYTAATFALVLWGWHHCSVRWIYRPDAIALRGNREDLIEAGNDGQAFGEDAAGSFVRSLVVRNRGIVIGLAVLAVLFIAVSVSVDGFFTATNILASLILAALLVLAIVLNK